MATDTFKTLRDFTPSPGKKGRYHSLAALEAAGLGKISRLPVSIRIVLESLVRFCDGKRVTEEHVRNLAAWEPNGKRTTEIPFIVVRIVLQDLIGFGALNDLSAMRAAAERQGLAASKIEPLVPVDVVVDHSVEIDVYNAPDAVQRNQEIEFKRNAERYSFVKWAQGAFETVRVVPPGNGIIHQINMEYLSRGVWEKDGVWFPDTVFGTDSHTTMVNGIGVVAWGVGGIEAEAGMLGQPNAFLTPDVVGCHMTGKLREGVTATDLGTHRHRTHAQNESRRQVRRVLRRRRGRADGRRPLHCRQHGAGIWRDDGLLSGRREDRRILPHYRPRAGTGRRHRSVLQGAGPVRHAEARRHRLLADRRTRSFQHRAQPVWPQTPAGPRQPA
jgi:hypothetical protein